MLPDRATPMLVVEDYKTMARIMHNLLMGIGFPDVDIASDGRMALDMIAAKRYGLVLSDWNMAPMTGIELLRILRQSPSTASIPFIIVTAERQDQNMHLARDAGANAYLVKPFDGATLKAKVEDVFALRAA